MQTAVLTHLANSSPLPNDRHANQIRLFIPALSWDPSDRKNFTFEKFNKSLNWIHTEGSTHEDHTTNEASLGGVLMGWQIKFIERQT